ncbi:hypothetical protein GIB67_014719 [Kingdonia uniflora]|uniref:Transmembrane protein n=1 Tax=Kingdonia uniflora TaxID=39325 RepID=A0A7J7NV86_9MAGN|nr:hypothetical protein GIB67_014719 [Kingdonia uniflora]
MESTKELTASNKLMTKQIEAMLVAVMAIPARVALSDVVGDDVEGSDGGSSWGRGRCLSMGAFMRDGRNAGINPMNPTPLRVVGRGKETTFPQIQVGSSNSEGERTIFTTRLQGYVDLQGHQSMSPNPDNETVLGDGFEALPEEREGSNIPPVTDEQWREATLVTENCIGEERSRELDQGVEGRDADMPVSRQGTGMDMPKYTWQRAGHATAQAWHGKHRSGKGWRGQGMSRGMPLGDMPYEVATRGDFNCWGAFGPSPSSLIEFNTGHGVERREIGSDDPTDLSHSDGVDKSHNSDHTDVSGGPRDSNDDGAIGDGGYSRAPDNISDRHHHPNNVSNRIGLGRDTDSNFGFSLCAGNSHGLNNTSDISLWPTTPNIWIAQVGVIVQGHAQQREFVSQVQQRDSGAGFGGVDKHSSGYVGIDSGDWRNTGQSSVGQVSAGVLPYVPPRPQRKSDADSFIDWLNRVGKMLAFKKCTGQRAVSLAETKLTGYVSETSRRYALPSQAQRHILAGLASAVGGLSSPYEKASHVHERPVLNWLWATGCHPFGPFSNTSQISQMLEDVALDLEEQLVDLSSLLYDHRLGDAHLNSSQILQSSIFTQQYVDHVLASEREKMRCCNIEYKYPVQSSQAFIYGGILIAGFFVYFVVIFFSSPVR